MQSPFGRHRPADPATQAIKPPVSPSISERKALKKPDAKAQRHKDALSHLIPRPGEGVVSREVSEELGGGFVAEASQSGSIVVMDEGFDEGVALGAIAEAVFA
ncbi:MAG TPA: hypothetical protein VIJ42_07145, partial [Stellaceae bacterium]